MKTVSMILRILMGLVFFVFGLNGFLHFMALPPLQGEAQTFIGALASSGYMLTLISGTQVVAGFLLIIGVFVPLALAILAPLVVNIFLFHLFLARDGMPLAIVVAAIEVYLVWVNLAAFEPMLRARSS